ncbi:MAG: TraB/GumN family protein [Ruminococcus sp.]|nr:TraB/GumN family protein [Ruminococcus sp.]
MKRTYKISAFVTALTLTSCTVSCGSKSSSSEIQETSAAVTSAETTQETTQETETQTSEQTQTTTEKPAGTTAEPTTSEAPKPKVSDYMTFSGTPQPAMWKATDPKTGNVLYMLGTVHIKPEDAPELPQYVLDVYDSCDSIAVEYNVVELQSDMSTMQSFVKGMMYTDGTTVKDHISGECYEKAVDFLSEHGMYSQLYDMFMPGFWVDLVSSVTLLNIADVSDEGVDAYFIKRCSKDGKKVLNIETLDAQMNVLVAYSDPLAEFMLSDAVDTAGETAAVAESYAQIYDCWASGEIDGLADSYQDMENVPDELMDDYKDYIKVILTDRNSVMADRAAEFLSEGTNCFFMVGAMHFSGSRGVDDLLAEKGYTVERIH